MSIEGLTQIMQMIQISKHMTWLTIAYVALLFSQRLLQILVNNTIDTWYDLPGQCQNRRNSFLATFTRSSNVKHDNTKLSLKNIQTQSKKYFDSHIKYKIYQVVEDDIGRLWGYIDVKVN